MEQPNCMQSTYNVLNNFVSELFKTLLNQIIFTQIIDQQQQ